MPIVPECWRALEAVEEFETVSLSEKRAIVWPKGPGLAVTIDLEIWN
jgi:hypothetical protein